MKCWTMSWSRPSNMSSRLTGPVGPSNTYSFSTLTAGSSRRRSLTLASALAACSSAASSSLRSASHSSADTIRGTLIVLLLGWTFSSSRRTGRAQMDSSPGPDLVRTGSAQHLQKLARRRHRLAVPHHGHDRTWVDHSPPALALKTDQAIRANLHAGELLILGRGEPDVADLADNHRDRPGLTDEGLEQLTDRLAGHEPITSRYRYEQDALRRIIGTAAFRSLVPRIDEGVVTVAGTSHDAGDEIASVPVAVVASRIEAELVAGMLQSNGLRAVVSADDAGGQEPPLQLQGVRVLVAPSDEASARRLLAAADDPST